MVHVLTFVFDGRAFGLDARDCVKQAKQTMYANDVVLIRRCVQACVGQANVLDVNNCVSHANKKRGLIRRMMMILVLVLGQNCLVDMELVLNCLEDLGFCESMFLHN